jgi:hypothetical protein
MRKLVVLHYTIADQSAEPFATLVETALRFGTATRTWHISATADVKDRKYHAGANNTVRRQKASVSRVQPPYIASNLDPVTVTLSKSTLYFFPDRLLVYSGAHVGAVSYDKLTAVASTTRFIEYDGVPSDSKVVDRTWKFVNKSGGPDRRFKDNRELPICAYGELALKSASGVNELLMISQQGPEAPLALALNRLAPRRTEHEPKPAALKRIHN